MLCRSVLEQMPEHVNVALILNPRQNSRELLASICDELSIPYRKSTNSLKYLVDRLNLYLLKSMLKANARFWLLMRHKI